MWRVTRVTDAFRYELQKEVDTSRRRIFCHIHWAEVSFLPSYFDIVCAHIYSHTQLRSLTVDFLSQLSRSRTCVHFLFDPQPQLRPIKCASSNCIYISPRSPTSLAKRLFTRFSRPAFLRCTDTRGLHCDLVPARRGAVSSTPAISSVSPYTQRSWTLTDQHLAQQSSSPR